MGDSPVLLILGAGPNAGASIAKAFAEKGYKVALAARRADPKNNTPNELHIPADLSVPTSVVDVFPQVEKEFGFPNVVIYNGSGSAPDKIQKPLGMPLEDFAYNVNINVNSVYASIHETLKGFEKLPRSVSKTFILTGNALNTTTFFPMLALGAGKAAGAHLIEYAARSYATSGYKFYYADQRDEDGSPAWMGIDGEATAKHYVKLSEGKSQGIWQQTFTPEAGYKQFSRVI